MNVIEEYAAQLVAQGAQVNAEDADVMLDDPEAAQDVAAIAGRMVRAIRDNPHGFVAWYRALPAEETE